jgi:hypothetical protein
MLTKWERRADLVFSCHEEQVKVVCTGAHDVDNDAAALRLWILCRADRQASWVGHPVIQHDGAHGTSCARALAGREQYGERKMSAGQKRASQFSCSARKMAL